MRWCGNISVRLGWIWTGRCFITRDRPHFLSCTVRKTRQFNPQNCVRHYFKAVPYHPQAAPFRWDSHPAAVLSFLVESQQETIQSATLLSAVGRKWETELFYLFAVSATSVFCWSNAVTGNLIPPLSGLMRSILHTICPSMHFHVLILY